MLFCIMKIPKTFATISQKESFRARFAEIISHNERLNDNYNIQFFDTATKSNYVFNGPNGKSILWNICLKLNLNAIVFSKITGSNN
jgi:hypothetical protein